MYFIAYLRKNIFKRFRSSSFIRLQLTVDLTSTLLFLDKVPIFCYSFKGYYFEQITGLKNDETCNHFLTNCLRTYMGSIYWIKNK